MNLFEIAHTLKRSRGEMYKNRLLWTFLDNHDVSRIASTLTDPDKLPIAYGLLFLMPGAIHVSTMALNGALKAKKSLVKVMML